MKKRRFLSATEANELSRQVTHERVKQTGLLDAANKATNSDPELGRIFEAVKNVSVEKSKKPAQKFASEATLKKLAGF